MKPVSHFRALVFAPFVYVFIVPVLIFHGALEFYHQIVFRGFRIPRVRLRDHLVLDRGLLKHLGPISGSTAVIAVMSTACLPTPAKSARAANCTGAPSNTAATRLNPTPITAVFSTPTTNPPRWRHGKRDG